MKLVAVTTTLAGLISLASTGEAATIASAVRETQKIRPTDPAPAAQSSIALSCARNEFCAFQIAVSAPASGAVTVNDVTLADLASGCSATIAAGSALVYREGFMDVTTPSNSAGMTGKWPDPLVPKVDAFYGETRNAFPTQIAAGQTQGFWVELLVPADQPAGMYAGAATVSNLDGSTAQIAVSIQVRDFTLPSTSSLDSAYGFDWDGPCQGHFGGYGGANCDDAQLEALNALYFKDALNHRITISSLVYAPPISNGQGDFSSFDTLYGPFLDGTALSGPNTLAGAKITAITYAGDQVAASYAAWAAHFKSKGWFDRVFDYTCDEPPSGCAWTDIPTRAAIVHAGDPEFRTLTTTSIQSAMSNGVLSSIDILVPIINYMDGAQDDPYPGDQRANYDTFLQGANARLWMYQSCEPSSSCSNGDVEGAVGWPTMFIDESAISNRMMQWMEFKYQVSADLYYDTTQAMDSQDAWASQYEFGNNGDGSIWYPGKPSVIGGTHDIPVESIRMKMLREGMQDYEYLTLLTALGDGAFAQTELAKVVTSAGSFVSDPSVLEATRLEMAAEIEKDLAPLPDGGVNEACDGGAVSGGDGGGSVDAGEGPDGSFADGGPSMSGAGGSGASSGCGCRATGTARVPSSGWVALAFIGGFAMRRTRRKNSPKAVT